MGSSIIQYCNCRRSTPSLLSTTTTTTTENESSTHPDLLLPRRSTFSASRAAESNHPSHYEICLHSLPYSGPPPPSHQGEKIVVALLIVI
mmetsp:Transcript_39928/g.44608  ORF Transcript_39928/g.44608 Transcript_39928/m.44608 type:complete len:90 (-) Transcript_39928:165-434(-)